jgi:predicted ATPase/DNA-binding SARP family transcriptional activator
MLYTRAVAPAAGPFVGRDDFVERIEGVLAEGERLCTIAGPGGMGKSRLARAIADRAESKIVVCDLHETVDADGFADAVAEAAGIAGASGERSLDRIAEALAAEGETLLVLDGFDRLVSLGPETVGALLALVPEASLLVTSRERLALEEEVVFELGPLPVSTDSVELLRALGRRAGRAESSDDASALVEIATVLEGIPLALELAASRLSVMGPRALVHRLTSGLDVLRRARRGGPPRHETLDAAVQWSWSLLRPFERDALAQCAVFRGGFTAEAAEAVVDLAQHPSAPPVIDVIAALRDRSLLRASEPDGLPGELRLSMYDCVREFAAARLAESALRERALERHAHHYVERGRVFAKEASRGTPAARRRLVLERENLLSVVERVMANRPITAHAAEPALEALLSLAPVLLARGPLQSYVRLLDPAVEAMKGSGADPALLARALALRGAVRELHGDPSGIADVKLALLIAQKMDDPALEAHVSAEAGRLCADRGELDAAAESYDRALALEPRAASALERSAHLAARRGDRDKARELYERALFLDRSAGRTPGAAAAHLRLAEIELFALRVDEARAHLAHAERLFGELDDRAGASTARGYRGLAAQLEGDLLAAREAYEDAARALEQAGFRGVAARFEGLLGVACREEGRLAEAHARLTDALAAESDAVWLAFFRAHLDALDGGTSAQWSNEAFARLAGRCTHATGPNEGPPGIDALVAPADADWFRAPNGRPVSLRNRKPLRRLLASLLAAHGERPGLALDHGELIAAAWPDERVLPDAAAHRLRVAVATLRRLGLKDALVTAPSGYLLEPRLRVHVIRATGSG